MPRAGPDRVRAVTRALAFGAVFALTACGFQPRGSLVALDDPGRLFLDADRALSIEEELRSALLERAFTLAPNRDAADIVLRVTDELKTQRIVSVRSTGRVSEFELAHMVSVTISRVADPAVRPAAEPGAPPDAATAPDSPVAPTPDSFADGSADPALSTAVASRRADQVRVTREYTYDESQVLGKENEARILRGEMSEELVRQIVLRTVASLARSAEDDGRSG